MKIKIGKTNGRLSDVESFVVAVQKTEGGILTFHYKGEIQLKIGFQNNLHTLWQVLDNNITKAVEKAIKKPHRWIFLIH